MRLIIQHKKDTQKKETLKKKELVRQKLKFIHQQHFRLECARVNIYLADPGAKKQNKSLVKDGNFFGPLRNFCKCSMILVITKSLVGLDMNI